MPRILLTPVFLSGALAACAVADATSAESEALQGAASEVAPPGADDVSEAVYFRGTQCHMVFRDVSSPAAETFFIWNLGVDGIVDEAPYPTQRRANLYAVFAPGPPDSIHHVDGEEQFDHYHIVDAAPVRSSHAFGQRYDGTWDVFLVFPGPSFDADSYQAARSVPEMERQIRDGILGPVLTTVDAGFDPLVLHAEIYDDCSEGADGHDG
jgi:hypothetical protein